MSFDAEQVARDRQLLVDAQQHGGMANVQAYAKLSGPGWLQSALTLGGGSLGSSLYLGVLGGTTLLWLQPFAMILGVIMLSAISYVVLSTGERPFRSINRHINPVLGWSWIAATLLANMVWSLPQYSLCFAICEQNFFPSLFQEGGALAPDSVGDLGKWFVSFVILAICTIVTWSYGSGSLGVKLYDLVLKLVVALIVASFVGVVIRMAMVEPGIDWGAVARGFLPDVRQFSAPAQSFDGLLAAISDPAARKYWSDLIVSEQRDVMLSAGAAAVGINMTFLLPYSLLSRGWDKPFRGLTIFDLSTGTFIPFVLATGCIVIAASQQFHSQAPTGFAFEEGSASVPAHFESKFNKLLEKRQAAEDAELPTSIATAEKQMAAVLVRRDTFDLAKSLQRLFANENGEDGAFFANFIFGLGVVGMTMSSISLMMLISGFVVCEICDKPAEGWLFRAGCMLSTTGVLWPLMWSGETRAWLTIVAGVFGAMLLPIAYVTFWAMMNNRNLLGEEIPRGSKRLLWNVLMGIAAIAAAGAGVSAIIKKAGKSGLWFVAGYLVLLALGHLAMSGQRSGETWAKDADDAGDNGN